MHSHYVNVNVNVNVNVVNNDNSVDLCMSCFGLSLSRGLQNTASDPSFEDDDPLRYERYMHMTHPPPAHPPHTHSFLSEYLPYIVNGCFRQLNLI
jgi:hypothetical protein